MLRAIRIATAAVLALAVAALPVILDGCVESCATRTSDTSAAAPACHHASSVVTAVGRVPLACGHDHNGTAVIVAKDAAPVGHDAHVVALIHSVPAFRISIDSAHTIFDSAPPGPAPTAVRPLPLRI